MGAVHALIFDQDGVLADTERDGHRVAFNQAFNEFGLSVDWDIATYGELIHIGGGKERMRKYFLDRNVDLSGQSLDELIPRLHKRKTDIFMELIEHGAIGLRPGVARLIDEAHKAGIKLAVCSTSNERAVNTLVKTLLGEQRYHWFDVILAGDMVSKKKPDPEIYRTAKEKLNVDPDRCVVIEDTAIGLIAARGAGMKCIVTVNDYTKDQEFTEPDLVVTSLGDADGERASVISGAVDLTHGEVTVDTLAAVTG